jgi:hypothetical protein
MKPFIRRVIVASRSLWRAERIGSSWADRVWRDWIRGYTSFDRGTFWDQPDRVCPFCFFFWRGTNHGDVLEREHSTRAAIALGACRCPRLPRSRKEHKSVEAPSSKSLFRFIRSLLTTKPIPSPKWFAFVESDLPETSDGAAMPSIPISYTPRRHHSAPEELL